MRLYQPKQNGNKNQQKLMLIIFLLIGIVFMTSCEFSENQQGDISVTLHVDGQIQVIYVPMGSTTRDALELGGIVINSGDRSDPPLFSVLNVGDEIKFIRVTEEFITEMTVLPYETEILRNESLPEGERRLIQPGVNGSLETTIRILLENGEEVSRSIFKTKIEEAPIPEIIMVGSQASFAAVDIPGKLVYISAGNAWIMENNTGIRRPIVTTGDLDYRIFTLSPDGNWLLFTRSDESEDIINTLWAVQVDEEESVLIDLKVSNIIHFADWVPGSVNGVVFSSVEPIQSPPGWQANNDLKFINFSASGWVSPPRTTIRKKSGGIYGWWGGNYSWSNSGEMLLYARPDEIGLVNLETESLMPLHSLVPLETRSDWAWVPEVSWSPDDNFIYFVDHSAQEGLLSAEESPLFDLVSISSRGGAPVTMVPKVGMFGNPLPSPVNTLETGENSYQIAYLQALIPTQSQTGGYQLVVMDRDGSNPLIVFPPEGNPGLEPNSFYWSPELEDLGESSFIAIIYKGNLWLIDIETGESHQLTGDNLVTKIDWK